jgi:enamine deaminase RidA (YjgF/YER057c/UK114 family)
MRLIIILSLAALILPCVSVMASAQGAPGGPPFSPAVVAGDFVYLAGTLPTGADGKVVAGDVKTQTARALDNLAVRLEAAGSRMEQVAAVTVYLKSAADFPAMNEVYAKYWPKDPPTRTTVVANLVVPEALIEVSMVALKNGVERQVVHPDAWLRSPSPYSYGIRTKNTLFLSGLVSRNGKDNTVVPGDMKAQTQVVLQNARDILQAAGMTLADVVSSRVYITDTAQFQEMNAAYRDGFPAGPTPRSAQTRPGDEIAQGVQPVRPPARATVRCALMSKDYLVEITMLAVKDPSRKAVVPADAAAPAPPAGAPAGGVVRPVLSTAIGVGDRLYLSGMLGNRASTKQDAAAQTRETLARIGRTLTAAGFEWKDVVDAIVYLPRLDDFAAMNGVYCEPFGSGPLPARATIEAGLVAPDGLVEIMMTAVKGEKRYVK